MSLIEQWQGMVVMLWQNTPILKRRAAMAL